MRTFTRYIIFELLSVFLAALAAMTLLIVLVLMLLQGMRFGLGVGQFMRIVPYMLPQALVIAIPATLLFAASSVYGRMSGSNEIIALKSLGVPVMTVVWPCLVISTFLSLTCVWLNDVAVSWGRQGAKRVVLESFEDIAYRMLKSNHAYRADRFSISVLDVQGKTLIQPELEVVIGEGGEKAKIRASQAVITADPAEGSITIDLKNMTAEGGEYQYTNIPEEKIVLSLEEGARQNFSTERPSELPLHSIPTKIKDLTAAHQGLEREIAIKSSYSLLVGDFAALTGPEWRNARQMSAGMVGQLAKLRTEGPRRWANGFSCLCFVIVGAPVAIRLKNADFLTSFFICFLPILLAYYPLLMFGVDQAKSGSAPPLAVWLANLVAAIAGYFQLRHVDRY